jgi:biotin carboxylase
MKTIIIVDAYSTGKYLAPAFKSYGFNLVHVQAFPKVPERYMSYQPEVEKNFLENIIFTDTLSTLEKLKKYDIKCVIAGIESGVLVADILSEALGLSTTNGTEYSLCRRNKFLMHRALESNDVAYIPQFKSNNLSDILHWIKTNNKLGFKEGHTPIVLKPISSCGTDNVIFCYSENEIENAFNKIKASQNVFGEENNEVLVQKFIDGQEYIVNTVSSMGTHYITDMWRINKKYINNAPICDFEELVSSTEEIFVTMSKYTETVLNALKIKFGAGHSEIMMTKDGPVLIETAARLIGGINPAAIVEVLGYTQISLLVESYLNPANFIRFAALDRLPVQKYVRNIFFISDQTGKLIKDFDVTPFSRIDGFYSGTFRPRLGDVLEQTNSYLTCPGFVYFISENQNDLTFAYEEFRKIERSMYSEMIGKNSALQQNYSDFFQRPNVSVTLGSSSNTDLDNSTFIP